MSEGNKIIYPSLTPPNPVNSMPSTAPEITSVSTICAAQSQIVIIQGKGSGDIQPQITRLGDDSVDTVWGVSTPSMVVLDRRKLLSAGAAGEWSGFVKWAS